MKRMIALLLCICMLMSLAACGVQPAQKESAQSQGNTEEMSREDKELVAELIGKQDGSDLSDEELDQLIDELLEDTNASGNVVNLSTGSKQEQPSVDVSENKDAYDENGAMTKPFDQVYPELIEKEQVAFSGESILVKLNSDQLTDGLKAAGIGALEQIVPLEGAAWYEAKLTEGTDAQKALEAVRKLKEVLLAEYNYEVQTAALDHYKDFDKDHKDKFDKNEHHKDQWHMHHCGIPDAFGKMETEGGSSSVVVAVIDSGVDYTHEDLKDNMWVNTKEIPDNGCDDDGNGYIDDYYGVDIIARQGNGGDTNGHGTHVAGIIAAKNNNIGVLGIAYNVKIMSVKAAMHNGTLNQADIARAVLYAYENGAQVINMSFGGTACSIAVQDALATAYTRCVLVASAGNSGANNEPTPKIPTAIPNYPAALTYVLGVMSVDESGVESSFTNWDVKGFNGVEYELYAPGENIMSTLPNNQYGFLSGTSMAAPVVSAFAAILRSEFSDPDMYPTKFIYGQLASTSEVHADCLDPQLHGKHNIPQVADLNAALTKLPKPEVNLQDYAIFDDPKYSEKNNGDGVIDAGETIALGLTLRNRWGMSENTQVTVDTKSGTTGLEDPYFTVKNPTVDYDSVGTYSTQDAGAVYTDGLLTGWEKPFLIEVAPNCPNDYRFTLNVTIQCENALDEKDTAVYTTTGAVSENVRAGFILPSIIEEDMVLTPDNLYIIPSATIIQKGVTVRVEPGTHIQFWSDDADDPYADSYIAYLVVNGKFLVEGTKDDPVYIYPSQLMDRYNVEINATDTGYVSLKYADVTNLFGYNTQNRISLADHCTFRYNYGRNMLVRALGGGVVKENTIETGSVGFINAKDSVFYKMGLKYGLTLNGTFQSCIFNQCGIQYSYYNGDNKSGSYTDCVFLGNSMVDQAQPDLYMNSSMQLDKTELFSEQDVNNDYLRTYYRKETGTTYVFCYADILRADFIAAYLKKAFGGDYAKIETEDENRWLNGTLSASDGYGMGVVWNGHLGQYTWNDGTPVDLKLFPNADGKLGEYDYEVYFVRTDDGSLRMVSGYASGKLYEIPGQILPEEITFGWYAVTMDMDTTYQIAPKSAPAQLPLDGFLYESTDETVVTVSSTGLVTPVGKGTADIYVISLDKAVKNFVTVTVTDYVPLESVTLADETALLAVGEQFTADCLLTPVDTTRRNIVFTSSDETVATVDAAGNVTGVNSGRATITATCEELSDTLEVTVYQKATSLQLSQVAISARLQDASVKLPQVLLSEGAQVDISWRSTDESVAVIEEDALILKALGTTSLIATDSRSGLSAACLVVVAETGNARIQEMEMGVGRNGHYVLLEDGSLYQWDTEYRLVPTCIATGVKDFDATSESCAILLEDGTIKYYFVHEVPYFSWTQDYFRGQEIVDIAYKYHSGEKGNFYVVTADGNAYAWGVDNVYGQLGVGVTGIVETPMLINLEKVVDIEIGNNSNTVWLLTEEGELYATGSLYYTTSAEPVLMDTGVAQICTTEGVECSYLSTAGKWKRLRLEFSSYDSLDFENYSVDLSGLEQVDVPDTNGYEGIGIRDGKVYTFNYESKLKEVPGITDAARVFTYMGTHYIATEGGLLFGLGHNSMESNNMAGFSDVNPVTVPVLIPLVSLPQEALTVTDSNLQEDVLPESALQLTFNKSILHATAKLYADGTQVTVGVTIDEHNHLMISRSNGFAEGVAYELVIGADGISASGGISNENEIRIPFTYVPVKEELPEDAPVVHESILDETVQRILTPESLVEKLNAYATATQYNPNFNGNVILNPVSTDTEVSHWLRVQAPSVDMGAYAEIPLGGNYWGSANEKTVGLQMIDYSDFPNYARLMYAPDLAEAPENTFPFVTSVKLFNKDGEEVTAVGNETVTFRVTFNRDMDTSVPLQVRFGSAYPYGDYEFEGEYIDARTWEGTYTLNTLIENGYQYFTISNGCSATDDLELQLDRGRFFFEIDTTAAQALIMQGTATDTGIQLKWTQDDFDTLMGYNVYRSDAEDGYYQRLNKTVIPADTMEFFDDTVEPGKVYYYNFTVVQTDMAESEPSGKIVIMSKDTMAPNIYHSPVANAFTGANLVLEATITDNLNIAYAKLHYRIAGTDSWKTVLMNKLNDKYSAIIPAQYVTVDGIEYYIEAFDGVSYTYKRSVEDPYTIGVQEAVDANALGDVDGDGVITNLDALLLLYAINDKYNLSAEEFARADLNGDGVLWAAEALRILQYVSGAVGSVKM